MSRLIRWLSLALFAVAMCASAKEPVATHDADRNVVRIPAQARIGDAALGDAQFEFSCTIGKGGALQVAAILPAPEKVDGFPLDDFEGPDGIGQQKTLATWSTFGPHAMKVPGPISGWRGVDGDGFLLATSVASNEETDFARLLRRWLGVGDQPLWLTVESPQGGAKLDVRALPGGYRTRLSVALSQCLAIVRHRIR